MAVPFKYSVKSFGSRKLTTIITVSGIALVVFVFAAVLMMAHGIEKTLVSTGSPDNAIVIRKSSTGEISSIVDGETQNIIRTFPYIAKSSDGSQIISDNLVVIINLNKVGGGLSNITVRGVSQKVSELRPQVKITAGRMYNPNLRELIAGESVTKNFIGTQIGRTIKFANNDWKIVGTFTTDGSGFDSEIWGDVSQLQGAFNRGNVVQSVTLKLSNVSDFKKFKKSFESDRRLKQYELKMEQAYFGEQSSYLATFIRILGIFITVIFSIGATVGATITMYAAVAHRTVEVGTMRALGFSRRSVLIVFLFESLLISLIGGAAGIILASFLQLISISTLNWNSFSEIAFSFSLSPSTIVASLIFSVFMGILGGFFPSVRAARLNIVNALRSE